MMAKAAVQSLTRSGANRLPEPTTDLDQVKRDFDEFGYGLIKDCLSVGQVARIRQRMLAQAEAERGLYNLGDAPNAQGVRILPNKGKIFRDLILQPQVTEMMAYGFRGLEMCLSTLTGIITHEGTSPQLIHCDQSFLPGAVEKAWVNNTLYMITEFTEENGGTRVVPGSHRSPPPKVKQNADGTFAGYEGESIAIEGPPGTAFVFDGRLWHGQGACKVTGPRIAISAFYVTPVLRQAENFTASLHDEVYDRLSVAEREMLGFKRASTLNYMEPLHEGGRGNTDTPMPYTPELHS
jgi:ectoine hydroxylase-related dioxygenase (phytanoyl-CoA dioxygenase family)